MPSQVAEEFLSDIFGKRSGMSYQAGLVESADEEAFYAQVENCREIWLQPETPYSRPGQLSFFDYFLAHYAEVTSCTMLKNLQGSVGLGCPPIIYTTKVSESLKAVIKGKVHYKETEWSQFNDELKQLADIQRDDAIRALSGRGPFH